MPDCIFCKIINKEIPSKEIYSDEWCYAFYDIDPKAPVHFLVVPREHIQSPAEINEKNSQAVAKAYEAIAKIARQLNLEKGFRVVANCGQEGGQTVDHLHFHVLAKRNLAWPPG